MDSFAEPLNSRARADLALSLSQVQSQILSLESEYKAKGIELTGRIIHVTHYLPLTATRAPEKVGVLSPPLTPPIRAGDVRDDTEDVDGEGATDTGNEAEGDVDRKGTTTTTTTKAAAAAGVGEHITDSGPTVTPTSRSNRADRWIIGPRWGHSAMFSGITSLGASREQLVIGWTGDLQKTVSVPVSGSAGTTNGANGVTATSTTITNDTATYEREEKVRIPTSDLSDEDKEALIEAIDRYSSLDIDNDVDVEYVDGGKGEGEDVGVAGSESKGRGPLPEFVRDNLDGVEPKENAGGKIKYLPVWLDDKVAHGHYDGYCKTTLWPLFHYLLWQDVASEAPNADSHWQAYQEANYTYARRVASVYTPGDLVWIHDYHLLLVPHLLRQLIPDVICGLFVHTPFPSSEIFRCLPRRREVLDGMLGANLVCFQTYSYSRHFVSSCVRVCGYEIAAGVGVPVGGGAFGGGAPGSGAGGSGNGGWLGIDNQGHVTTVTHCPVGVDAERIARDACRESVRPKIEALRSLYEGKKIIVARDKLDAVKGVLQKLRAFERLLQDYPEWVGNVVLIQVTSPALTDSPKLERQVSELVAHINGEFGALDFVPVHHYHQTIKRDEFYALLSVADLAVITPLRDGMNTTSMEFVIAQGQDWLNGVRVQEGAGAGGSLDGSGSGLSSRSWNWKAKRSPIVLSEFMGISTTMEGGALQVNPWDLGGVAKAINRGLRMGEEEKMTRHRKLWKSVTTHTSHTWAAMLVRLLMGQIASEHTAHSTPLLDRERLEEAYRRAGRLSKRVVTVGKSGKKVGRIVGKKRLFLFDYDGTLTPIVKTPSMAVPSKDTLEMLKKLSEDERNVVYIISGRDAAFLDQHLGHLKRLGMSAEHGSFLREPFIEDDEEEEEESTPTSNEGKPVKKRNEWKNLTTTLDMSWMPEVEAVFRYYTERTAGSHIEIKKSSITWHYRSSDPEWGAFQCRQCQDLLENNVARKRPIEVMVGKKNLEVRSVEVNKGVIVRRILEREGGRAVGEEVVVEGGAGAGAGGIGFVFCAGDDKTDEDMFRALVPYTHSTPQLPPPSPSQPSSAQQPPTTTTKQKEEHIISLTPSQHDTEFEQHPVPSILIGGLGPDSVFSTSVGASSKKTLAGWHVTTPGEVVEAMLGLVRCDEEEKVREEGVVRL